MPKNGFFCLNQHRMDVIGNMSSVRHETGAIVAYTKLYSPYRVILWSKLIVKQAPVLYIEM